jgi:hypothetical protein
MRPIIKTLKIRVSAAGPPTEEASVKFEEMTFFNTQPIASSVVPAMMKVLFQSVDRTAEVEPDARDPGLPRWMPA